VSAIITASTIRLIYILSPSGEPTLSIETGGVFSPAPPFFEQ
jgi:hypothetical protein